MSCGFLQGFAIIVVHFVDGRFCLFFCCLCHQLTKLHGFFPEHFPQVCVIGELFCQNIFCPIDGIFHSFHAFFRVYESGGVFFQRHQKCLSENVFRQRRKTFFLGNGCTGAAFGAVRTVNILDFCLGHGSFQFCGKLIGHGTLFRNGIAHHFPFFFQISESCEPFRQLTDNLVIQRAGDFLTITGNERHGVPFIQQFHGVFHLRSLDAQFYL